MTSGNVIEEGVCLRYSRLWVWTGVTAAVAIAAVACVRPAGRESAGGSLDVSSVHAFGEESPLLLEDDDSAETVAPATGPVADNSRCHVCHINFADEELAVEHARADVGCETCHGPSDAHCNDEDNITPPDVMFPVARINPTCMGCHPRDEISILPHRAWLNGTAPEGKRHCTGCHGDHRIGYRTRRWDKVTGELIQDDKVRVIADDPVKEQ